MNGPRGREHGDRSSGSKRQRAEEFDGGGTGDKVSRDFAGAFFFLFYIKKNQNLKNICLF